MKIHKSTAVNLIDWMEQLNPILSECIRATNSHWEAITDEKIPAGTASDKLHLQNRKQSMEEYKRKVLQLQVALSRIEIEEPIRCQTRDEREVVVLLMYLYLALWLCYYFTLTPMFDCWDKVVSLSRKLGAYPGDAFFNKLIGDLYRHEMRDGQVERIAFGCKSPMNFGHARVTVMAFSPVILIKDRYDLLKRARLIELRYDDDVDRARFEVTWLEFAHLVDSLSLRYMRLMTHKYTFWSEDSPKFPNMEVFPLYNDRAHRLSFNYFVSQSSLKAKFLRLVVESIWLERSQGICLESASAEKEFNNSTDFYTQKAKIFRKQRDELALNRYEREVDGVTIRWSDWDVVEGAIDKFIYGTSIYSNASEPLKGWLHQQKGPDLIKPDLESLRTLFKILDTHINSPVKEIDDLPARFVTRLRTVLDKSDSRLRRFFGYHKESSDGSSRLVLVSPQTSYHGLDAPNRSVIVVGESLMQGLSLTSTIAGQYDGLRATPTRRTSQWYHCAFWNDGLAVAAPREQLKELMTRVKRSQEYTYWAQPQIENNKNKNRDEFVFWKHWWALQ